MRTLRQASQQEGNRALLGKPKTSRETTPPRFSVALSGLDCPAEKPMKSRRAYCSGSSGPGAQAVAFRSVTRRSTRPSASSETARALSRAMRLEAHSRAARWRRRWARRWTAGSSARESGCVMPTGHANIVPRGHGQTPGRFMRLHARKHHAPAASGRGRTSTRTRARSGWRPAGQTCSGRFRPVRRPSRNEARPTAQRSACRHLSACSHLQCGHPLARVCR
jgi:hypothetical protein